MVATKKIKFKGNKMKNIIFAFIALIFVTSTYASSVSETEKEIIYENREILSEASMTCVAGAGQNVSVSAISVIRSFSQTMTLFWVASTPVPSISVPA